MYTHIFYPLSILYLYIISMKQVQAKQVEHKHINEPYVYLKGQYNSIQGQLQIIRAVSWYYRRPCNERYKTVPAVRPDVWTPVMSQWPYPDNPDGLLLLVYPLHVRRKVWLDVKDPRADAALVFLDVTKTMHQRQVLPQRLSTRDFFATNVTTKLGIRVFSSSVRRVVVNVNRWLVTEDHVTQLTLDSWRPRLEQTKVTISICTRHVTKQSFLQTNSD